MPTYDYLCTNCSHHEEVVQKMSESPLTQCMKCQQSTLKRGPGGGIGLQFQGNGFYITDYCSNSDKSSTQCCPCNQSGCSS